MITLVLYFFIIKVELFNYFTIAELTIYVYFILFKKICTYKLDFKTQSLYFSNETTFVSFYEEHKIKKTKSISEVCF